MVFFFFPPLKWQLSTRSFSSPLSRTSIRSDVLVLSLRIILCPSSFIHLSLRVTFPPPSNNLMRLFLWPTIPTSLPLPWASVYTRFCSYIKMVQIILNCFDLRPGFKPICSIFVLKCQLFSIDRRWCSNALKFDRL